jgi:uncharacterized protein YbjT (DUF2867 family)
VRVLIFGATGMIGQAALRACLLAPDVSEVVTIGRRATGGTHAKLREIVHDDLLDYGALAGQLAGFDACLFCLGIASSGMSEADYSRVTYEMPIAAARALQPPNPDMVFVYISAAGADSSEQGRIMWARVKGCAENALLKMPFRGVYVFRPLIVRPLHGIESRTTLYRLFYKAFGPLLGPLERLLPRYVTTTDTIGNALLKVVRTGAPKHVLECEDINRL